MASHPYGDPVSWHRFLPTTLPEHPLGDLAHLLRRQRAPQVLAAIVLAAISTGLVARAESRATAADHRWGTLNAVVVADSNLAAGTTLDAEQVSIKRLPAVALAVDALNERFGQHKVRLGAQDAKRVWRMKQEKLSPCYTTKLSDIITVRV